MAANDSLTERLVQAALRAAEEGNWRTTTVADLALMAEVDPEIAEARFSVQDDVLDALARQTDERVISALDEEDFAAASPKERLLEALMCRLDVLAPHRAAFREFGSHALRCPNSAARTFGRIQTSMGNVLDAAGLAGSEFERAVRATALAYVWIRTCRRWLLDEEERSLDSVFAMLDQELSRIETLARCLEGFAPRNPA
ncbi:MAG: hypothetical protein OXI73_06835 [Rhodospirillales bacterium]|nr:hypothetical protein [Rhodospirillales bacterium]MYE19255.1 hypothetical protein [Rhodospirillales bacterium]